MSIFRSLTITSLWEDKPDSEKSCTATYDEIISADFNLSPFRYKPLDAMTKGISPEEAKTYLNELKDIVLYFPTF